MTDAAGDVRTGTGNLTVGDQQRRASGGFAIAALGHNGDVPGAIIGLLRESRCAGGGRQSESETNSADAATHELNPSKCLLIQLGLFASNVSKIWCTAA